MIGMTKLGESSRTARRSDNLHTCSCNGQGSEVEVQSDDVLFKAFKVKERAYLTQNAAALARMHAHADTHTIHLPLTLVEEL